MLHVDRASSCLGCSMASCPGCIACICSVLHPGTKARVSQDEDRRCTFLHVHRRPSAESAARLTSMAGSSSGTRGFAFSRVLAANRSVVDVVLSGADGVSIFHERMRLRIFGRAWDLSSRVDSRPRLVPLGSCRWFRRFLASGGDCAAGGEEHVHETLLLTSHPTSDRFEKGEGTYRVRGGIHTHPHTNRWADEDPSEIETEAAAAIVSRVDRVSFTKDGPFVDRGNSHLGRRERTTHEPVSNPNRTGSRSRSNDPR